MIAIQKNSWHYRIYSWWKGDETPTESNICIYFWEVVFAIIIGAICFAGIMAPIFVIGLSAIYTAALLLKSAIFAICGIGRPKGFGNPVFRMINIFEIRRIIGARLYPECYTEEERAELAREKEKLSLDERDGILGNFVYWQPWKIYGYQVRLWHFELIAVFAALVAFGCIMAPVWLTGLIFGGLVSSALAILVILTICNFFAKKSNRFSLVREHFKARREKFCPRVVFIEKGSH